MELELTSGTVERDGEEIYWEFAAAGADDDRPVVVLTHGAGGSHAVWYQQVPALGRDFRVLCWDSRGFGNSTNHTNSPTTDAAAGDLDAVLDECGVSAAHVVGQSLGGWYMSAFALTHPDRVLSITYADTIGGLWTPALREAFAQFSAAGGLSRPGPTLVGDHRALWPGTAERDPAKAFLYQALGSFHTPPLDELYKTVTWSVSHDEVAALGRPVLFVAGTHDGLFPAEALAESSRLIDGARYVEIPASGHSPYFEQPEAWNDAVRAFLREA